MTERNPYPADTDIGESDEWRSWYALSALEADLAYWRPLIAEIERLRHGR